MKIRQQTERVIEDNDELLIEGVVIHGVEYTVRLLRTWPTKPENERGLRIEFWKGKHSTDYFAVFSWAVHIDKAHGHDGVFAQVTRFLARPGHDHSDVQDLCYHIYADHREVTWDKRVVHSEWLEPLLIEFGSAISDERR